jgi:hypothetical protein
MLVTLDLVRALVAVAAFCHPDLGNLHPDLHSSVSLGGVYANLPGDDPGYSS